MSEPPENVAAPIRARNDSTNATVLGATLDLLAELGYAGVTVDQIAARARVSKATMYRRWPSKLQLVIAAFEELPELPIPDTGDLRGDLRALIDAFLEILRTTQLAEVLPSLASERARNSEMSAKLDPVLAHRRRPFLRAVARAAERGELSADVDAEVVIDAVMGPLVIRLFFTGSPVNDDYVDAVITCALSGIGAGTD